MLALKASRPSCSAPPPREAAGAVVLERAEQRAVLILAVPGGVEVIVDQRVGAGVQRQIPRFFALAGDLQVRHAPPRVSEVLDLQLAQLLAPQRVKQQRRQDGAVALFLHRFLAGGGVLAGSHEQIAGLVVAERRRLAFAALGPGPLDAFDRVVSDRVVLAEILEERRQRGQAMPDRGAALDVFAQREVVAPGDDVRPGHDTEIRQGADARRRLQAGAAVFSGAGLPDWRPCAAATAATNALDHQADIAKVQEWLGHANIATTRILRSGNAGEPHEIADRVLVGAPCAAVADIGEPLNLGRHVGEPVKFRGGQETFCRDNSRW